jgi:hypothetical protein
MASREYGVPPAAPMLFFQIGENRLPPSQVYGGVLINTALIARVTR